MEPVQPHVLIIQLYIHRSGRTARQHRDGISILFCCPEEMAAAAKLIAKLSENGKRDR